MYRGGTSIWSLGKQKKIGGGGVALNVHIMTSITGI